MNEMWSFRPINSIEEAIFNSTLERFYKYGIDGLVRENIQNSLDGALQEASGPVEVFIKTGDMTPAQVPGIETVKKHIAVLKGQNTYTRETITHMQACMEKSVIPYISFEDRNTKGLTGAEHGENIQDGDTWGVYAYKKGVHFTDENESFEKGRGGSHGIGKIASNAASDLYMMYFSNCDANGKMHIGGTVQLIEHTINGQNYRSTGYFTKVDAQNQFYPYENTFDEVFKKDTRGLKIVIPYLRQQFTKEGVTGIVRAVCDNFFLAILEKKLVVTVDGKQINHITLYDFLHDTSIYPEQNYEDFKKNFTPLYVETYTQHFLCPVAVKDKINTYLFKLYFMYDEEKNLKKGRVAIVRGIGMKIQDFKVKSFVNCPFNAVLIPNSTTEDEFLKSLENEAHTELAYDHIKNPDEQENAKRFINNLTRAMQEIIEDCIRHSAQSDGLIDTSDLIYSLDVNFQTELKKNTATVQLSKGDNGNPTEVVKVNTGSSKTKKTKEKHKERKSLLDRLRRARKKEEKGAGGSGIRYDMEPEAVKRIVTKDKERLAFDFTKVAQYSGEIKCDVSLSVIDGTGAAKSKEFDMASGYSEIMDLNTGNKCVVKDNIVKEVSIQNNKVNLEMKTTDQFNESLKFMYFVEV